MDMRLPQEIARLGANRVPLGAPQPEIAPNPPEPEYQFDQRIAG